MWPRGRPYKCISCPSWLPAGQFNNVPSPERQCINCRLRGTPIPAPRTHLPPTVATGGQGSRSVSVPARRMLRKPRRSMTENDDEVQYDNILHPSNLCGLARTPMNSPPSAYRLPWYRHPQAPSVFMIDHDQLLDSQDERGQTRSTEQRPGPSQTPLHSRIPARPILVNQPSTSQMAPPLNAMAQSTVLPVALLNSSDAQQQMVPPNPSEGAETAFHTPNISEADSDGTNTSSRPTARRRDRSFPRVNNARRRENSRNPQSHHSVDRLHNLQRDNAFLLQQVNELATMMHQYFDAERNALQNVRPNETLTSTRSHCSRRHELEELPVFDGQSPDVWLRFEATYHYLVRRGLTDDEIISGFNKTLKGEAYHLVEHLLVIRVQPKFVMEQLRDFYGDRRNVINRMTKKVLTARPMKSSNDPDILELAINVKRLVTNIQYFEMWADLESTYLQEAIVSKLCEDHQDRWRRLTYLYPEYHLQDLADFIMMRAKECTRRKPDKTPNSKPNVSRSSPWKETKHVNVHEIEEALESVDLGEDDEDVQVGVHQFADRNEIGCYLCHGKHRLVECVLFLTRPISERYELINSKNICSCCLASTRHVWKDCPKKIKCTLNSCTNFHHPLLHRIMMSVQKESRAPTNYELTPPNNAFESTSQNNGSTPLNVHLQSSNVLYGIAPALIKNNQGQWTQIYVMIDSGSGATLINESLRRELNLNGVETNLKLKWTDDSVHEEPHSLRVQVTLKNVHADKQFSLEGVQTVTDLKLPTQTQDACQLKKLFPHLADIPVPSFVNARPSILIGLPHVHLCFGSRLRCGSSNQPIAIKTPLGWVILGSMKSLRPSPPRVEAMLTTRTCNTVDPQETILDNAIKRFFQIDSYGVEANHPSMWSKEEKRAQEIVTKTMKRIDDRYEIGLFWRDENLKLPDSYDMAFKRLKQFEKHLLKNPKLQEFVEGRIKNLLDGNHARIATEADLITDWPRVWYLPIFVVVNPHKPKPRLVCDAAAMVNGVSLNSAQITGPNLLVPIAGPLFRMRQYAIAVSGDVRDMFTQIRITPADQQCQRFLWRSCDDTRDPEVYIHQSMIFGSSSSPFSSQVVKNSHAATYADNEPEAYDALVNGTYVDDYADSRKNVHEAARVTNSAIQIMGDINLHLVNFQSNSKEVLSLLPATHVKAEFVNLEFNSGTIDYVIKILGMKWNVNEDFLQYRADQSQIHPSVLHANGSTKRQLLSTIMKIYDPLGLISHFHLQGRLLLQEAWRSGKGWDEPLPDEIQHKLSEWVVTIIEKITTIKIPRCYSKCPDPDDAVTELHVFVDASELAMGAIGYFRIAWDDQIEVVPVMGRGKAMPMKTLSTPQAELTAAVMGVRLARAITQLHTYPVQSTTFWTDSKCVLLQLHTTKRLRSFFAVRVNEILESSKLHQWRHVPTLMNPADYVTKWHNDALDQNCIWFQGPEYLRQPPNLWPDNEFGNDEGTIVVATIQNDSFTRPSFSVPTADDWLSTVKATAIQLRGANRRSDELTPADFDAAENYIFASIQAEAFPNDYDYLQTSTTVTKNSKLWKLSPFMGDDGVIRLQSRLQNAPLSYTTKNPAILPNKHPLVARFIQHFHELHDHVGESQIIAAIRTKAWIIGTRTAVRRVATQCDECKIRRARVVIPKMADLPEVRVTLGEYPFEFSGSDVWGPVELSYGRTVVKRWVIIFVCMKTRAVYMDMLYDLTADEVLQALNDFQSTRGRPKHIYSDQGTNFHGANNIHHKELDQLRRTIGEEAALRFRIQWHFNPSHTPHFGGCWERLIGSVKSGISMAKMIKHRPSERIFRRAIKAVEGRMNARPLTFIPLDHNDQEPLTPNHFLLGHANNIGSPYTTQRNDEYSRYGYRRVQYLQQEMWKRWIKEYLPVLTNRTRWHEDEPNVEVGDKVWVIDGNQDRDNWKRAVVKATIPGKDRRVRVVVVKMENNVQRTVSAANIARLLLRPPPGADPATGGGNVVADVQP